MAILVRCNSSEVLSLQPVAANSYMANGVRGNSSKVLALQPIEAHSYMAIFIRGWGGNSSKSSHCSPTLTSFYPSTKLSITLTSMYPPPPPLTTKWEDFRENISDLTWDGINNTPGENGWLTCKILQASGKICLSIKVLQALYFELP